MQQNQPEQEDVFRARPKSLVNPRPALVRLVGMIACEWFEKTLRPGLANIRQFCGETCFRHVLLPRSSMARQRQCIGSQRAA